MSYVDPANSKVLYGARPEVLADGTHAGVVKVRLRDDQNNPVSGRRVELHANPTTATITQPGLTNAEGTAVGYVRSDVTGPVTISARVIPVDA
jgi:hypothetical protein